MTNKAARDPKSIIPVVCIALVDWFQRSTKFSTLMGLRIIHGREVFLIISHVTDAKEEKYYLV